YLLVPGFNGQEEKANKFAYQINQLIKELNKQNPCGWIIDLRHNGGGNMWPMIAGLIPFLQKGKLGSFIDSSGREKNWYYEKDKVLEGKRVETTLPPDALLTIPNRPYVAILIGPETASAAEAVAIAFKTRPHTRFFGQKTAGLATANQYFLLKDGAELLLTVAYFADRNKNIYKTGLLPDELVVDEKDKEDSSIKQATMWLLEKSKCKKER
ncbi:MAG TPA: S41 family peptidase, partial [Alphaproteobacteria bacterium]|nr:S41 family peptidase [Alphaproteobacteria bacterium]